MLVAAGLTRMPSSTIRAAESRRRCGLTRMPSLLSSARSFRPQLPLTRIPSSLCKLGEVIARRASASLLLLLLSMLSNTNPTKLVCPT